MKDLIERNKIFYRKTLVDDNQIIFDTKISRHLLAAYSFVNKSENAMIYLPCIRNPIIIGNTRGYECSHLKYNNKTYELYTYSMTWKTNWPLPSYIKGHEPKLVLTGLDAVLEYEKTPGEKVKSWASANVSCYLKSYGAKSFSTWFLQYNDDILNGLENDLFYGYTYLIHPVGYEEAMAFSESGGLAIAERHNHITVLYGRNYMVDKRDQMKSEKEKCAWCLNIGKDKNKNGYNSIYYVFNINYIKWVKFYILLRKNV